MNKFSRTINYKVAKRWQLCDMTLEYTFNDKSVLNLDVRESILDSIQLWKIVSYKNIIINQYNQYKQIIKHANNTDKQKTALSTHCIPIYTKSSIQDSNHILDAA